MDPESTVISTGSSVTTTPLKETTMQWETPKACNLRFGFEITMYVANR